jgi:fructuronate reductase
LGNFFRAHQAWYTAQTPESEEWGIAAFTGSAGNPLAARLRAQGGRYTLVTRSAARDETSTVGNVVQACTASDHIEWLEDFRLGDLALVTVTVTEAGYVTRADGGVDFDQPVILRDLDSLRQRLDAPVSSAPARLVAGLAARWEADLNAITLVPCDNLPDNGSVIRRVVQELAEQIDDDLATWITEQVSVVDTVVDRITPRLHARELRAISQGSPFADRGPVVTEPYREWVLAGTCPAGRPSWEVAGANFVASVTPYEQRKLWFLNGAHSLMAYAGSILGHRTIAEAGGDPLCRRWIEEWWREARAHVDLADAALDAYCAALLERFSNPRLQHQLAQIAIDGSRKIPARVVPVLCAERTAGRPAPGACRILAGWILHLRGEGVAVSDVRRAQLESVVGGSLREATTRILELMHPSLRDDADLVTVVVDQARTIERARNQASPT